MIRRHRDDLAFWERDVDLREVDLTVEATSEDIRPGNGDDWALLWERTEAADADAQKWEAFFAGDDAAWREERWLLGS